MRLSLHVRHAVENDNMWAGLFWLLLWQLFRITVFKSCGLNFLVKNIRDDYPYTNMWNIYHLWLDILELCENINSVNPLCLMIHSATGYFKEKYGEKYLILDSTEKYDEVFSGIKKEIETINGGKELFYEKNYARIGVNTDDDVPLNKPLKFPTLTIIIRLYFKKMKNCAHKSI